MSLRRGALGAMLFGGALLLLGALPALSRRPLRSPAHRAPRVPPSPPRPRGASREARRRTMEEASTRALLIYWFQGPEGEEPGEENA